MGLVVAAIMGAAIPAQAEPPVQYANATFVLPGSDGHYIVSFTMRRGFSTSVPRTDLVVDVLHCSPECTLEATAAEALPESAFAVSGTGARLKTTWLRRSLTIDWRGTRDPGGRPSSGVYYEKLAWGHYDTLIQYRLTARRVSAAMLGARIACTSVGDVMYAEAGASEDLRQKAGTDPRPESIAGLSSTKGRCG